MKVKLIGIKGYNYKNKDGVTKSGKTISVSSLEPVQEDDNNGNYKYGLVLEEVFLPKTLSLTQSDLVEMLGKTVDLVYIRGLGDRYERLTDIVPCD